MSEIIFSCECGMTLKVRDDEQTGGKVTCPSCDATVRVPSVRPARVAATVIDRGPEPDPELESEFEPGPEPESAGSPGLGILYLGLVSLLTVGAVGFLLIPALSGTTRKAPDRVVAANSTTEPSPKKPKTSAPKKGPRASRSGPVRVATEALPKTAEEEVTGPRAEGPADPPEPPAPPPPALEEITTKKAVIPPPPPRSDPPKEPEPPKAAVPRSDDSPYAHIKDPDVRKSLEFALKNAKFASSAGVALRFMNAAEKKSNKDPQVLADTRKLRDMINEVRSRAP